PQGPRRGVVPHRLLARRGAERRQGGGQRVVGPDVVRVPAGHGPQQVHRRTDVLLAAQGRGQQHGAGRGQVGHLRVGRQRPQRRRGAPAGRAGGPRGGGGVSGGGGGGGGGAPPPGGGAPPPPGGFLPPPHQRPVV